MALNISTEIDNATSEIRYYAVQQQHWFQNVTLLSGWALKTKKL